MMSHSVGSPHNARYVQVFGEGQFPVWSMGPKIENAIRFLESGGKCVIISSLELAEKALAGRAVATTVP